MENVEPQGNNVALEAVPAKAMKLTQSLRVKKLCDAATLPARGSAGAAGYDLARCGAYWRRIVH